MFVCMYFIPKNEGGCKGKITLFSRRKLSRANFIYIAGLHVHEQQNYQLCWLLKEESSQCSVSVLFSP